MKNIYRVFAPVAALVVATMSFALTASAEVDVQTLGGGRLTANGPDYGTANGNTFSQAQFNTPWAMALDSTGNMYLADRLNNVVRKISAAGNTSSSQTTTYLSNLNAPIGVTEDSSDNLYVLTSDNVVRKYNKLKNLVSSNYLGAVSGPSAMTLAPNGTSLYVCYTSGCILELYQNGTTRLVLSNCGTLRGIGVLPSGEIVVSLESSTSFNNAIVVCSTNSPDPANPIVRVLAGNHGAGYVDGTALFAQFNGPHGLAVTVDGKVVVADRYNNRVRVVDGSGTTTTLYGVDSAYWDSNYFPGWADGPADSPIDPSDSAAAREPVGVCISTNGIVFTTEVYYHILRDVTGSGLTTGTTGGNTNGGGGPLTVPAPSFSPNCGYYPNCETITVTSGGGSIYYTMDGTEPTTNSIYIPTINNVGTFTWCNATKPLAAIKMKAFSGTNSSATVTGVSCGDNEIGFPRDMVAGVGSTVYLPIVVNLQSGGILKSLQFRVEVTPANGAPPMLGSDLVVQTVSANDFVQVVPPGSPTFQQFVYTNAPTRGLVISAPGNTGLGITNYAEVALLKVTIPKTCVEGQSYQLNVLVPSGTSDGLQADVPLTPMAARMLTVQTVPFLSGDSAPGYWYNEGDFGTGGNATLSSADVNNAMYAALGIRVPFTNSDAFAAMDTVPVTSTRVGDGFIGFNDWQNILSRSLGLSSSNMFLFWGSNGRLQYSNTSQTVTPHDLTPHIITPGTIWLREAAISSGTAVNQLPGSSCSLPVSVNVVPGYNLAGMQFRATLVAEGNAPTPGAISFSPAAGITGGQVFPGAAANDILCVWSLGAFATPLTGSNYLGQISFTVPSGAASGQHYSLRFSYVDGSPDLNTIYQLESFPGSMWVMSSAASAPSQTSDEWKTTFFGSLTNTLAADNADADGDGVQNWKEFVAGTDPLNATSCLQFSSAVTSSNTTVLTWLTAPAKTYVIEAASSITATSWTAIGTNSGDGTIHQVTEPNNGGSQFYRIRVQP